MPADTLDAAFRADLGSRSDYNVYANNSWTPFMRHNWNDNNLLADWQSRYDQDKHSVQMPIDYQRTATGFRLLTRDGLDIAGPLPEAVTRVWQPRDPKRVGADLVEWP